jgi:enoyl-CoA hydratase/carnithine racemase
MAPARLVEDDALVSDRDGWTDAAGRLLIDDSNGVRCVTFDRPSKLNAMTDAMFDELTETLVDASLDHAVSCLVLTGTGRAFSVGWDIAEMEAPPQHRDKRRHGPTPCLEELAQFAKPLICAVNGLAVGFGATTPLHSDLVIAATEARFRFPFAELGLAGESAVTATLPMRVGYQEAARLLLTCDWVDAEEAVAIGLAWKAVPAEQLMPVTMELACRIAKLPRDAVAATKGLLLAAKLEAVRSALARERASYALLLGGPSNRTALEAFSHRRTNNGEIR